MNRDLHRVLNRNVNFELVVGLGLASKKNGNHDNDYCLGVSLSAAIFYRGLGKLFESIVTL